MTEIRVAVMTEADRRPIIDTASEHGRYSTKTVNWRNVTAGTRSRVEIIAKLQRLLTTKYALYIDPIDAIGTMSTVTYLTRSIVDNDLLLQSTQRHYVYAIAAFRRRDTPVYVARRESLRPSVLCDNLFS